MVIAMACQPEVPVAAQEQGRVSVTTTRFGRLEIDVSQVLHFPEGMLGFEDSRDYGRFAHAPGSPFYWLQSMTEPQLAFVAINPFEAFPTYDVEISDFDVAQLGLESPDDVEILAIVTFAKQACTVNLVGPVVMNRRTHVAKQVVLTDPRYGTRHPLPGG